MVKKIFIDANIFLEIFLDDSKSKDCIEYLRSLTKGDKQAVTSDFIIYSCILQAQNKLKETKFLKRIIMFFNSYNLNILRPSLDDFYSAIEIMDNYRLDFDDSLVVSCMKSYGITELASLDKHFDKIKSINRINF